MKDATISELYDLTQTIAAKIFEGKTYPWEVLPLIKDFILELGEHSIRQNTKNAAKMSGSQKMP